MVRIIRGVAAAALAVGMGLGVAASGQQQSGPPPAGQTGTPTPAAAAAPPQGGQAGQGVPPAEPAAQQRPPVFRGNVNAVRVDAIISDRRGNPVTDLTKDDFEVYEDGKLQALDLFKLVNSNGTVAPGADPARPIRSSHDEETEAARDDVRLFLIFLDDYHVRKINAMRMREQLVRFVQNQLGPLDMVAIMYPLTSVRQLTFTREPISLISALRAFDGRKYDYRPRNAFEEQYANYPAQEVETVRNQVTMTALKGAAVRLGSLREGRKAIIFVSEGFTSLLPPQLRDPNAQMPGVGNPNTYNPTAGSGSVSEQRARFSSDAELMSDLRDVFNTANQNNTAIYALDPRGLAFGEFDVSDNASIGLTESSEYLSRTQDTLHVLANNTDGRAIVNRNDLDGGLKQVVRDTSAYYLLGYTSPMTTPDGKFHEIKVRVKRPGVQVRSRKGYWAPTAEEAARASAPPKPGPPKAVEQALATVESRQRDAFVSTWIGYQPSTAGDTRVTLVWEPAPPVPGEKREAPAAVEADASNKTHQFYKGTVPESGAAVAAAPAAGAAAPSGALRAGAKVSFDATPGRMTVRLTIRNEKGQILDSFQQEAAVPDFTGAPVKFATPVVLRARTPREFQSLSRDPDPVPTSLREFSRTDRLLIRAMAHAPGATPSVAARLLNRGGQKMADLTVQAPADAGKPWQLDIPLAGLSPGEFLIELKATVAGGGEATELIAIRVIT
jgi:VWFA-related protein